MKIHHYVFAMIAFSAIMFSSAPAQAQVHHHRHCWYTHHHRHCSYR